MKTALRATGGAASGADAIERNLPATSGHQQQN
jgi:hypothetical protein